MNWSKKGGVWSLKNGVKDAPSRYHKKDFKECWEYIFSLNLYNFDWTVFLALKEEIKKLKVINVIYHYIHYNKGSFLRHFFMAHILSMP